MSLVLFVYGLAVTVTLISLWGQAVVADTGLLAEAAASASDATVVSDQIERWLVDELATIPGVDRPRAESLATAVVGDPALSDSIDALVRGAVEAVAAPAGERVELDVARILRPAVPEITSSLGAEGVVLQEEAVAGFVAGIDPLVLREESDPAPVGPESETRRDLTVATAVGLSVMAVTAAAAIRLSDDRRAMMRSLLTRVAVSAFAFVVMFRLGAWALDPGAGRAPIRSAVAQVAGAKLWLPLVVAGVAGGAAWGLRTQAKAAHTAGRDPVR